LYIPPAQSHVDTSKTATRSFEATSKPAEPDISASDLTVMIVDDEDAIARLLYEFIATRGLKAIIHNDPVNALRDIMARDGDIDLMITDQTMPNMLGTELIRKTREMNYSFPILLCTGFSETVDQPYAKKVGADAFLFKPIDIEILDNALSSLLHNKLDELKML
jgi:DNA-binding response OmpR family regulator